MKSKGIHTYSTSTLLLLIMCSFLTLVSCVDEGDLDLPDDEEPIELSKSTAIISLLRAVEQGFGTNDNECFDLLFPIQLGFSNNLTIQVDDYAGLQEVALSVVKGQHINSISYPILVTLQSGTIKSVETEDEFLQLLDECTLLTLRDEFDKHFTQCFDFSYPIEMINLAGDTVTIGDKQAYFDFELIQGFEEQPVFVYPLEVSTFSQNVTTTVNNDFEFFEIYDACSKCPRLFFNTLYLGGYRYRFEADFPEIDLPIIYEWYIDGTKIEDDGAGIQGDNVLERDFEAGFHEICLKYQSIENDCAAGVDYCQTIFVEDVCPFISYEAEQINETTYVFIANFEAKDDIEYTWAVYQNDELIFFETEIPGQGDNRLEYQFDVGSYVVCVEAEPQNCPEVLRFCQDFTIN